MKVSLITICLTFAAVILSGCGGPQATGYKPESVSVLESKPYKPGDEDALFPFRVGNEWTYQVEAQENHKGQPAPTRSTKRLTLRVTNVVRIGKTTKATVEAIIDGRVNERQVWVLNESGLFQTSVGQPPVPYTPMMPAFRTPLTKGAKFSWSGNGFVTDGTISKATAEGLVLGPEEVDTALGRVQSIGVQTSMAWSNGRSVSVTWFSPGVGIVRWRQEIATPNASAIQVMRLVSKIVR